MQKKGSLPLFRPLGVYRRPLCEPVYFLEVRGQIEGYRLASIGRIDFLTYLQPSGSAWAAQFPRATNPRKVDRAAAVSWLLQELEAAGPYDPPEHLKPRGRGRPRKDTAK